MKMTIEWHESCLANSRRSLAEAEASAARAAERLVKQQNDVLSYEAQIKEAKKRGIDGFDPERFLKQRQK